MPDTTPDPVAAYLTAAKARAGEEVRVAPRTPEEGPGAAEDSLRLGGAVEAVLARHQPGRAMIVGSLCGKHEAHRHFSITSTEAADVRGCPDCTAHVFTSCTGCVTGASFDHCPDRKAIRAALLGEEGTE
jgi:hypothetical protein